MIHVRMTELAVLEEMDHTTVLASRVFVEKTVNVNIAEIFTFCKFKYIIVIFMFRP